MRSIRTNFRLLDAYAFSRAGEWKIETLVQFQPLPENIVVHCNVHLLREFT